MKPKAFLRDRLYVPAEYVTEDMCGRFESQIEIGKDGISGDLLYQSIQHYQIINALANQSYFAFNRGNLPKVFDTFTPHFEIIDERVENPMRHPLKIVFPKDRAWYDYQPDAIEALMQHDYGLLKAPARSGKTLILCASACADRQKTIVFAHQTDLLLQYLDTFEQYTNLLQLRKETGEKIVGLAEEWSDFDELDVVFCTKQTFDHPRNRQYLPRIQKLFGHVQVDEAHLLNADLYSLYVNRFWARKRQGCSATPNRKDQLQVLAAEILGPEIHEIPLEVVKRVPVEVHYHYTGISLSEKMEFVQLLSYLSAIKSRNELIVGDMVQDVRAGHTGIAVTDRKEHARELQEMLRQQGVSVEIFTGKVQNRKKRKEILDAARIGNAQMLIAMRNMTTGLDIPRADVFYNLLPSANAVSKGKHAGEGGYEQQCSRVLTNFPGKEKAIIRDYIDNVGTCWGCKKQREKTYRKIGATLVGNKEKEKKADQVNLIIPIDGARSNKF